MRARLWNFIAPALAVIFLATPLAATRVRHLTLTETRDRASTIVVADVLSVASRLDERGEMVWTDYTLRVAERLKGEGNESLLQVSFAGGKAGGLDVGIAGSPRLTAGSRYVFFLRDGDRLAVPAVGWGQGIFRVPADADGELVSLHGETIRVTIAGELQKVQTTAARKSDAKRLARPEVLDASGNVVTRIRRESAASATGKTRAASLNDLARFVRGAARERIEKEAP